MNFSLNTFLVSISGPPFVFTKVRILLLVCELSKSCERCEKPAKRDIRLEYCATKVN